MREILVGDWVAFYRNGEVVISEVRYLRRGVLGAPQICTSHGVVGEQDVLEARRAQMRRFAVVAPADDNDEGDESHNPALIDEHAAAERLNLRVATLRRWRWAGNGPAFRKIGNAVRYATEDLAAFIEAGRRTSSRRQDAPEARSPDRG